MRLSLLAGFVAVLLLLGAALYLLGQEEASGTAALTVSEALAGDTTGFLRATAPRPFVFPADHGPHPGFKTEWWYVTGNLRTPDEHRFGYQFTLFRIGLAPPDSASVPRASDWATDHLFMGHFAVTDVTDGVFYDEERFSRGAAGLAGARAEPFEVWLEGWRLEQVEGAIPPLRVRAEQEGAAIDLVLEAEKPLVLQGDRGFDRKGPGVGNASFYYSFTRLATDGTVTVGGQTYRVEGLSWMDREWSTSVLSGEQVGWDWFSLHLDDGRDLMYYQIREADGVPGPFSHGVLVSAEGEARRLTGGEVQLEVMDRWQSPRSGADYPSAWRLRVPGEGLDLRITASLPDQELDAAVRYWEGAVDVAGSNSGRGYAELTGYDTPGGLGGL